MPDAECRPAGDASPTAALNARCATGRRSSIRARTQTQVAANNAAAANATAPAAATRGAAALRADLHACHTTGAAGAPKVGDKAAWAPRIAQGIDALTANAIKGKGAMPPQRRLDRERSRDQGASSPTW